MDSETSSTGMVKCPWCAEEILAEARKCKHCGEFLTDDHPGPLDTEPESVVAAAVTGPAVSQIQPVWKHTGMVFRCVAHNKSVCLPCKKLANHPMHGKKGDVFPAPNLPEGDVSYSGKMGSREQLSAVGEKTDHGLACPKCGGTQFIAKRSNTGKAVGFATLGVGGLVAPKSQVKCVTCGTKFKRG